MREKLVGIYAWINKVNGKIYIGSSIDLTQRIKSHLIGKNSNTHLQNAIKEYGIENFQMTILEFINFTGSTKDLKNLILEREQFYLDDLCKAGVESDEFFKISYNKNRKAASCLGTPKSEESKLKMSLAKKGRALTEEWKENIRKNHISKHPDYIHFTKLTGVTENQKKGIIKMQEGNKLKLLQYDLKGKFIKEWASYGDAAKFFGVDCSNISRAVKDGLKLYKGYFIMKKVNNEDPEPFITPPHIEFINVYNSELKLLGQYNNPYHIEKELKINHTVVSKALAKTGWSNNNYFELTKERI